MPVTLSALHRLSECVHHCQWSASQRVRGSGAFSYVWLGGSRGSTITLYCAGAGKGRIDWAGEYDRLR